MRLIDIEGVALLKTVTDGGLSAKALWRRINSQPTVDAVPVRHGKWVETEFLRLRECSCCHVRWGMYDTEDFKYCPNCGARMDEDV